MNIKKKTQLVLLLMVLIPILVVAGCERETYNVSAKVLSIDTSENDINKVGVVFMLQDQEFICDLKLLRSELAYFKDDDTIPLVIEHWVDMSRLTIYLKGREVEALSATQYSQINELTE